MAGGLVADVVPWVAGAVGCELGAGGGADEVPHLFWVGLVRGFGDGKEELVWCEGLRGKRMGKGRLEEMLTPSLRSSMILETDSRFSIGASTSLTSRALLSTGRTQRQ